jgi:hypothetical protein
VVYVADRHQVDRWRTRQQHGVGGARGKVETLLEGAQERRSERRAEVRRRDQRLHPRPLDVGRDDEVGRKRDHRRPAGRRWWNQFEPGIGGQPFVPLDAGDDVRQPGQADFSSR